MLSVIFTLNKGIELTEQEFFNCVIQWDNTRFLKTGQHLQPDTIVSGFSSTVKYLKMLKYSDENIGNDQKRFYFLKQFLAWIRKEHRLSTKNPKLFPILPSEFFNSLEDILRSANVNFDNKKDLPICENPSHLQTKAAMIIFQYLSFLRPSELYHTSYSQAIKCAQLKYIHIAHKNEPQKTFLAQICYTNVTKHKTSNLNKTKFSAFITGLARSPPKMEAKYLKPSLMGISLAILRAVAISKTKNHQWDSLMCPSFSPKGGLQPLTAKDINNAIKYLHKVLQIDIRGLSYCLRRSSFSTLAWHQVEQKLIQNAAAWSSNRILAFYCNENPLSDSSNITKLSEKITDELLCHVRAHDLYNTLSPAIEPVSIPVANNFVNDLKDNIESDTDSLYGEDQFHFQYHFADV